MLHTCRPGFDVPVAEVLRHTEDLQRLNLIPRLDGGKVLLEAHQVDLGVGRHVGCAAGGKHRLTLWRDDSGECKADHGILERHGRARQGSEIGIDHKREARCDVVVVDDIGQRCVDGASRVQGGVLRDLQGCRQARSPAAPVHVVRGLRVEEEPLAHAGFPVGRALSIRPENVDIRGAVLGFTDAGVHLVAEAVVQGQVRRDLPGILNIKIVGLAADGALTHVVPLRKFGIAGRFRVVGKRSGGQEAGQRIRQRIARENIVQISRGRNGYGRISRAASEGVDAVRREPEYGGVPVEPDFKSRLQGVRAAAVAEVLAKLNQIAVVADVLSRRRVEGLVEAVGETDRRLTVVGGGEERRGAEDSE